MRLFKHPLTSFALAALALLWLLRGSKHRREQCREQNTHTWWKV